MTSAALIPLAWCNPSQGNVNVKIIMIIMMRVPTSIIVSNWTPNGAGLVSQVL